MNAMTEFKIEKSVPLPAPRLRYPFPGMAVGDSFPVAAGLEQAARVAAHTWGKTNGCKFTCRKTDDGFRIWRIA